VVFIPGLCLTHAVFEPLVPLLSKRFELIFVDLPGHGANRATFAQGASISSFADLLGEELAHQGIDRCSVVGFSLGATVMYSLNARARSVRIDSLISVEQSPYLLADNNWNHAAFGQLSRHAANAMIPQITQNYGAFLDNVLNASLPGTDRTSPVLLERIRRGASACVPETVAELFSSVIEEDWRPGVVRSGQRLMVIHGEKSCVYPTDVGQWIAQNWKPTAYLRIGNTGHMPFLEESVLFASCVEGFVNSGQEYINVAI
jgi:pimeloyl-[acyl-carrier protein] methyl ester esterase